MPLIGRRRPLMRAAMVGGAGYVAGKHIANKQQAEATQDQEISDLQQGQAPAQAPAPAAQAAQAAPAAPPMSEADRIDALTKLKGLLDSGVLTQEQYEAEKAKLLGDA